MKWYETVWFKLRGSTVLLMLNMLWLKISASRRKKNKQLLESMVRRKTEDLEEALRIKSASENVHKHMIAAISHDIRNPVKYISIITDQVQRDIEKNAVDEALAGLETVRHMADRIFQLVDNMLSVIKPEIYNRIGFEQVNLRALVDEKTEIFSDLIRLRKGVIRNTVSPEVFVYTNPILLGVIIHNLIDNAVKIKSGNEINVFFQYQDDLSHLFIADHGPGIPSGLLEWLNSQLTDKPIPVIYEGLGLLLVRQISAMLNIGMYVKNIPDSCFQLTFNKTKETEPGLVHN